jgi:nitric oxide reductase NorE protein
MTNLAGSRRDELDGQSITQGVDKHSKFIPGQPDMWAFVLFETLVFTSYFVVYLLFRTGRPEAFLQSQADLDLRIGIFNTIVLLTSSWSVARCVQASREGGTGPR